MGKFGVCVDSLSNCPTGRGLNLEADNCSCSFCAVVWLYTRSLLLNSLTAQCIYVQFSECMASLVKVLVLSGINQFPFTLLRLEFSKACTRVVLLGYLLEVPQALASRPFVTVR